MSTQDNILYLFDRPTEPMFIEKGDDPNKLVSFDVPTEYLVSLLVIINIIIIIIKNDLRKLSLE